MFVYDPRGMTWDQWCKLVCELFAAQQLQPAPEAQWQNWVSGLVGIGYFTEQGVPDARGFNNWQQWAQRFVGIMNFRRNLQ